MLEQKNSLLGKVAVITGAGRGIGRAISLEMAKQGAFVFLLSRTEKELRETKKMIRDNGGGAEYFITDVSNEMSVHDTFTSIYKMVSKIYILVNNAGIQPPIGLFSINNIDDWKRAVEVNLFGTVHCIRAVINKMIENKEGSIINLSGGGAASPRACFSGYAVSKTAVVRLTETLAVELHDFGIRVNAISPGAVNTKMLDEVLEAGELAGKEYVESLKRKQSGGTDPRLAAQLVCFLASDLSQGITGKLISAVWDSWRDVSYQKQLQENSNLATLRRIDNKHCHCDQ